jgi:hypothetical protein
VQISICCTFLNLHDTIEDKNKNKAFDQLSSIAVLFLDICEQQFYRFLHCYPSFRKFRSAFPLIKPTRPDHHFSTIQPVPVCKHPFDQPLPLPRLSLSSLYLVGGFFLLYAAY